MKEDDRFFNFNGITYLFLSHDGNKKTHFLLHGILARKVGIGVAFTTMTNMRCISIMKFAKLDLRNRIYDDF